MECCTRTPSFVRGRSDEEGRAGKKTEKTGPWMQLVRHGSLPRLMRCSRATKGRGRRRKLGGRWMEVSKHRVIIRKRRWKWMGLSSGPILYVARNSSWCMERTYIDRQQADPAPLAYRTQSSQDYPATSVRGCVFQHGGNRSIPGLARWRHAPATVAATGPRTPQDRRPQRHAAGWTTMSRCASGRRADSHPSIPSAKSRRCRASSRDGCGSGRSSCDCSIG